MINQIEIIFKGLQSIGWQVTYEDNHLSAFRQIILSRWFFGSRRLTMHIDCFFDPSLKKLVYQEYTKEITRGLAPPAWSFSAYRQHGTKVNITREDTSIYGGGKLNYGETRQWIQSICDESGWTFHLDINPAKLLK